MKQHVSNHSHRDEKLKLRSGDYDAASLSRTEEERMRRRREWKMQQKREQEHERLKKKMILEYEMRRAREEKSRASKGRSSHHSHSSSRSKSPQSRHGRTLDKSKPSLLCEKLEPSNGTTPLFKGPEGTQISVTELRRIKVDIHRNIPGKSTVDDLQRDIINPEDVSVKRRAGEGSKPIFEREEIKNAVSNTEEVGERRTVVAINNEGLENKSKSFKKYTGSPTRARSHSPRRTSPHRFRHEDSKHTNRESYRSDREKDHDRGKNRELKEYYIEKERRRAYPHGVEKERSRERSRRDHSRSRERQERKRDRDSRHRSIKDERSYQEYRGRSRECSRERRERGRSRELRVPPPHYIEQIPVPIYCGNFPPRPIMVGSLVPIRTQIPFANVRHPPMVGPLRPFPPRFIPPDVYRMRPPPNPRFGSMY